VLRGFLPLQVDFSAPYPAVIAPHFPRHLGLRFDAFVLQTCSHAVAGMRSFSLFVLVQSEFSWGPPMP